MAPTEQDSCRPLRADARRNRERITHSAREVFAEQGLEAPIAEITRRAGIGAGTFYRHFPDRDALITSVFDEKMDAYVVAAQEALADPDPWQGFCTYVEKVCGMQAEDRGFTYVLTSSFPTAEAFEAKRAAAYAYFVQLIARAKTAGRLRQDFSHQDLILLLMANAGVVAVTGDTLPDAWRRPVAYMLQAFDATNTAELPPAPGGAQLSAAMTRACADDG